MSVTAMVLEGEPDRLGRMFFTLYWLSDGAHGVPVYQDGVEIGRARGQCFRADPEEYIKRGAVPCATEAEAKMLAWGRS